jgi:hypothetical protein
VQAAAVGELSYSLSGDPALVTGLIGLGKSSVGNELKMRFRVEPAGRRRGEVRG